MVSAAPPRDAVAIAWVLVAAGAVFAVAALLDPRTLPRGEDVWAKPLRFALAFTVQVATLLWLRTRLGATGRRGVAFDLVVRSQAWICVGELLLIAVQGARGVESHFNYVTAFDRAVFTLMGIGTAGVLLTCLAGAVVAALRPRPLDLAVAAGLLCCAAGGLVGVRMTFPTPDQAAALAAGLRPSVIGAAHAAEAGATGLPLLGWKPAAGDWRVAHFLGIHGLQVLPLLGLLAARRRISLALGFCGGAAWIALFLAAIAWSARLGPHA